MIIREICNTSVSKRFEELCISLYIMSVTSYHFVIPEHVTVDGSGSQ